MLSITLDWLSVTFKEQSHAREKFSNLFARAETIHPAKPTFGYTECTKDANGVLSMWNPDREEMGHHIIFAGSALRHLFQYSGVSQRGMVQAVSDAGGHITRLDVAKDLDGIPVNLENVYSAVKRGENQGTCRTVSKLESGTDGITVYMGSRQSEKFARIYNKRAQLGLTEGNWFRYELETKGLVARALAGLLVETDDWGAIFDGIALGMVDLPKCKEYGKFFSADTVPIGLPQLERQTNRESWIQLQVIPAIVEHYHEHRDSEAVRLLRQLLDFEDNKPE